MLLLYAIRLATLGLSQSGNYSVTPVTFLEGNRAATIRTIKGTFYRGYSP
jgi:hypothetical protein